MPALQQGGSSECNICWIAYAAAVYVAPGGHGLLTICPFVMRQHGMPVTSTTVVWPSHPLQHVGRIGGMLVQCCSLGDNVCWPAVAQCKMGGYLGAVVQCILAVSCFVCLMRAMVGQAAKRTQFGMPCCMPSHVAVPSYVPFFVQCSSENVK